MAEQLNRVELMRLARLGATSRLEELRREIVSLESLLGGGAARQKSRAPRRKTTAKAAPAAKAAPPAAASAPDATKSAWSPRHSTGWSLERIAPLERSIMRTALYEALHRDDVPVEVAIDEAVELAKQYCGADAPGFVNGVLGAALEERGAVD